MIKVAFIGNPNVGKSALINAVSGSKLKIGNWPGVTIEKKEAFTNYKGEDITFVDLPGIYSLNPYSNEEIVTRDYLIDENPDIIVNVIDSTNLERNLYLTNLLKDLNIPMIVALNFNDEFKKLGYNLDLESFQRSLNLNAVEISATKKQGLDKLMDLIVEIAKKEKQNYNLKNVFSGDIEQIICKIRGSILAIKDGEQILKDFRNEFLIVKILESDECIFNKVKYKFNVDLPHFNEFKEEISNSYKKDVNQVLAEQRYISVDNTIKSSLTRSSKNRMDFTRKVDKILLNRFLGLPIFFILMIVLMSFVFNGSTPFIDFVDGFFGDFVSKYVGELVEGTPNWVSALATDGIVAGIGGVLTFVPLMLFLFFILTILEESGYMNRVAFLMDRIMRGIGLNGKAFVPMIIGFGCSVPAIFATRALDNEKNRKVTAMLAPFMSCGARLPVYGLFSVAFFGKQAGIIVASLYFVGIVVAIILGLILKKLNIYAGDEKATIIELPPYRMPTLKIILNTTFRRIGLYIKKASTVILGVLIILWALSYFPNNGDTKKSFMADFGHILQPILAPTGFATSWEAAAAVVPSIAAKEVVVGFMAQVLPTKSDKEEGEEKTTFIQDLKNQGSLFIDACKASFLGIISFNLHDLFSAPDEEALNEEASGVVEATKMLYKNDPLAKLRAYSFMVFILLVVPCIVTLAVIKQEFGIKFMFRVIVVMTIIPYIASTLIFQIGKLFY